MKFTCDFCNGTVRNGVTRREYGWGGKHIATFENVPCGICDGCGECYFDAEVAHQMDLLAQPIVLQTESDPQHMPVVIDFIKSFAIPTASKS